MTPDERQLLSQLFHRIREVSHTPRDREAEDFIAQAMREQPYAPYLMAQTIIVQDEALKQAQARIEALEAELNKGAATAPNAFLGGAGRAGSVPTVGGRAAPPVEPMRTGPWGQAGRANAMNPLSGQGPQGAPQGGSFLRSAMATAAGVAGSVLLAQGLQSMFGGQAQAGQESAAAPEAGAATPASAEDGMLPDVFGDQQAGLDQASLDHDPGLDDMGGDDWA